MGMPMQRARFDSRNSAGVRCFLTEYQPVPFAVIHRGIHLRGEFGGKPATFDGEASGEVRPVIDGFPSPGAANSRGRNRLR